MLEIKELCENIHPKTVSFKDTGLGCCNRLLKKEKNMVCRLHGFQKQDFCEGCRDKNIFKN